MQGRRSASQRPSDILILDFSLHSRTVTAAKSSHLCCYGSPSELTHTGSSVSTKIDHVCCVIQDLHAGLSRGKRGRERGAEGRKKEGRERDEEKRKAGGRKKKGRLGELSVSAGVLPQTLPP